MVPITTDYEHWQQVPLPELTSSQLRAIARQHRLDTSGHRRIPSAGVINSVYSLDDRFVVRVPRNIAEGLRATYAEAVSLPAVTAAGIRCPQLIALDDTRRVVDVPFTVSTYVTGVPMSSRPELEWGPLLRELGRELARLHTRVREVQVPLADYDVPLFVRVGRGCRIAPSEVAGLLGEVRERGNVTAATSDWFEQALASLEPMVSRLAGMRRFLHLDAGPWNVMVDQGRLQSLIDWGNADWGDPALDFRAIPLRYARDALVGYREISAEEEIHETAGRILWDKLTLALFDRSPAPARVIDTVEVTRSDPFWSSLIGQA